MRNASDKILEKIKTQFYIEYPFSENRAVCDTMCKNMLERDRLLMKNNTKKKRHDLRAG